MCFRQPAVEGERLDNIPTDFHVSACGGHRAWVSGTKGIRSHPLGQQVCQPVRRSIQSARLSTLVRAVFNNMLTKIL